ncbi:MAG: S8 family serine peptidase, partial [Pararhodobacter sp.]|nr:S8 family serine peptidase [Pararhodobacter sp.]
RTEGARYEHVLIGPRQQAEAARQAIEAAGGTVIRTRDLDGLGQTLQVATFPGVAAFDRARGLVAERAAQSSLSLHHLYGFAQSRGAPRLYAPALIGETGPGRCPVARPITIGMIDGPVNTDHPVFRGASVTYESLVPAGPQPGADHGTAVAALLVGQDGSGALAGFAQGARLHAISVFSDRDAREEASVERIAQALDRMVQSGIGLINLLIAGPENPALGRALQAAAAQGVVRVGASGNVRRPAVAWPAASPDVIAVTAVDAARRRFRMANTGAQIEFSAPGVDVYAARAQGAGYVSGTSFATPIVTALVARQMARGVRSSAAIRAALRAGVETLGPGSRNTEFGWGLVKASGC